MSQECVDEGDDVMRPADQLQVRGKPAIVAVVVTRMLDRCRNEPCASKCGQAVMMTKTAAAGAVRNTMSG